MTTVAMPHAMPSMVSAVRRRLWRMALYDSSSKSRIIRQFVICRCNLRRFSAHSQKSQITNVLLLPQRFNRFQSSGLASWIDPSRNACDRQAGDGEHSGFRDQTRRIESAWTIVVTEQSHEAAGQTHPDQSADHGEQDALGEELHHDAAIGCTQRLAQSNFSRALGHGYEHDVDDSDRAESEGNQADGSEEFVHRIEDGTHPLRLLNRVPVLERVNIVIIEMMVSCNDAAGFVEGKQVVVRRGWRHVNK